MVEQYRSKFAVNAARGEINEVSAIKLLQSDLRQAWGCIDRGDG